MLEELTPYLIYNENMSFGEGALQRNHRTRGGTIETLTDCFFAVVCAESYDKLLKKNNTYVME